MSESDNKTLTRAHEQRKIRWNGKNKYGSYKAYDDAIRARKFQRDQQRAAIKRAEENGEFIPAKTSGVATVHAAEAPKSDYRARPGAFAALFVDESDDESDDAEEMDVICPNKHSDAEVVTPMLGGNNTREANLTKPTWFEMCDSDEED
jgi:hypothetical protein